MVQKENKLSWTMLMIIVFIALLIQNIFYPGPSRSISNIALLLWSVFGLFQILQIVAEIRKKTRLDRQREASARGDTQKLAQEQPVPDPHALSLPMHIQHLPRNGFWIALLYLYTVVILIFEIIDIFTALQPADAMRDLHVQVAIILPVTLIVLWLGTWLY